MEGHSKFKIHLETYKRTVNKITKCLIIFEDLDTPTIRVNPSGTIKEGRDVTLTCEVDSRPTPHTIIWHNVTDSDRAPSFDTLTPNNGQGLINNIDILDSGGFQCTAANTVRSAASATKNINVVGKHNLYPFVVNNWHFVKNREQIEDWFRVYIPVMPHYCRVSVHIYCYINCTIQLDNWSTHQRLPYMR